MSEKENLSEQDDGVLRTFDGWLSDGGPAAISIREMLEPVEGPDGVFFPATFAAEQGNDPGRFRGGYNIDEFPDGTNVCLVDTVGSQGNRIEPMFARREYAGLVPQVNIKINDGRTINILEAGHRAGDAIVRSSELKTEVEAAFKELLEGKRSTAGEGSSDRPRFWSVGLSGHPGETPSPSLGNNQSFQRLPSHTARSGNRSRPGGHFLKN